MSENVALIQMSCGEDIKENYDKATERIREAASLGANIVCTQELFKTGKLVDWEAGKLRN